MLNVSSVIPLLAVEELVALEEALPVASVLVVDTD